MIFTAAPECSLFRDKSARVIFTAAMTVWFFPPRSLPITIAARLSLEEDGNCLDLRLLTQGETALCLLSSSFPHGNWREEALSLTVSLCVPPQTLPGSKLLAIGAEREGESGQPPSCTQPGRSACRASCHFEPARQAAGREEGEGVAVFFA